MPLGGHKKGYYFTFQTIYNLVLWDHVAYSSQSENRIALKYMLEGVGSLFQELFSFVISFCL